MLLVRWKPRRLWLGSLNTYRQRNAAHGRQPSRVTVSREYCREGGRSYRVAAPSQASALLAQELLPGLVGPKAQEAAAAVNGTGAKGNEVDGAVLDLENGVADVKSSRDSRSTIRRLLLRDAAASVANDPWDRFAAFGNISPAAPTLPRTSEYGPWTWLLTDYDRLERECMFTSSTATAAPRLVDDEANAADVRLWSCLLTFGQRRHGDDGVVHIWRDVSARRILCDVKGTVARHFWHTVLDTALRRRDDEMMASICQYAEWMHAAHGVQWPDIYATTVASYLDAREYSRALWYHLAMYPTAQPSAAVLCSILKRFACEPDEAMQATLRSIYVFSKQRQLYDVLLPHLYHNGQHRLARKWRSLLVSQSDLPASKTAARPFLRFLVGYHPSERLVSEEQAVAGLVPEPPQQVESRPSHGTMSELLSRYYGFKFGIEEKGHNDSTLARWFATKWVSLSTAIDVVHALGITKIGPLSLQSIALRDGSCEKLKDRLRQLRRADIEIARTNYTTVVLNLVREKDDESLSELLHSDIHPDVLDDVGRLGDLARSFAMAGDFRKHQLLVSIKLALTREARTTATDFLLTTCLDGGRYERAIEVLRDMKRSGLQVLDISSTTKSLHACVKNDVDSALQICSLLADTGFPVPSTVWRTLLFSLGRAGRLDDLERLALRIADHYGAMSPMLAVHYHDLPDHMAQDMKQGRMGHGGASIPADLHASHPKHPLRLIFPKKLQGAIVRWTFRESLLERQRAIPLVLQPPSTSLHDHEPRSSWHLHPSQQQPLTKSFFSARGVALLRQLRASGVWVSTADVRRAVLVRLVELFGPAWPTKRQRRRWRTSGTLSLAETKALFDAAWAWDGAVRDTEKAEEGKARKRETLLPPLEELEETIARRNARLELKWAKFRLARRNNSVDSRVTMELPEPVPQIAPATAEDSARS